MLYISYLDFFSWFIVGKLDPIFCDILHFPNSVLSVQRQTLFHFFCWEKHFILISFLLCWLPGKITFFSIWEKHLISLILFSLCWLPGENRVFARNSELKPSHDIGLGGCLPQCLALRTSASCWGGTVVNVLRASPFETQFVSVFVYFGGLVNRRPALSGESTSPPFGPRLGLFFPLFSPFWPFYNNVDT
jgi:hypothetical protein